MTMTEPKNIDVFDLAELEPEPEELSAANTLDGRTPTQLWTAEAYLKRFAMNPGEETTELMPEHGRWVRACRRLWERIDSIDRAVWMREPYEGLSRSDRNRRRWRLQYLLLIETGLSSRYQILIPEI